MRLFQKRVRITMDVHEVKRRLQTGRDAGSFTDVLKSDERGEALKKQGNLHFGRRELQEALNCYAKAAFISPWPGREKQRVLSHLLSQLEPSKQRFATNLFPTGQKTDDKSQSSLLALCVGNRSAVLCEMNRPLECLADIELALSLGFPCASQHKLHRRRALCLAQLGWGRAGAEKGGSVGKTLSGRDHGSHVSRSITRDFSTSRGHCIRATRDIEVGEVVVSEGAYAAVLNFDLHLTHCSHCFHQTSSLIPCCWCVSEGYCSSGCREEAWLDYHWLECRVSDMWLKADWMMRMALRMLVAVPASALQGALSKEVDKPSAASSSKNVSTELYAAILSLVAHKDKFSDKQQMAIFSKMAGTMVDCFGDTIKSYLHAEATDYGSGTLESVDGSLRSLFLHHLLQLRCNSHSVTDVLEAGGGGGEVVQPSLEVYLGSAVFPTASLFNHSCWPNIFFRFQGSSVVAVATRPIRKGEEANNCYGPQLGRMKRAERMAKLQKNYFFHCSCLACSQSDASLEKREMVMDAYLCPACGGAMTDTELPETQWQCRDCHSLLESSDIEKYQELVSETEKMFSAAFNAGGQVDLSPLLNCHLLQSRLLHCHNMQLARTRDALAQAHASTGEFSKAVEYCAASCQAVEAVHGSHSIECATELHKLAQLLFNSGQFGRAAEVVERALALMRVYHHPSHSDITELEQMKEHLCT